MTEPAPEEEEVDPRTDNEIDYDYALSSFLSKFGQEDEFLYEVNIQPHQVVFKMVEWTEQDNGTMSGRFWTRIKGRGETLNEDTVAA